MKTNVFFSILISVLLTLNLCTQPSKPEPAETAKTSPGATAPTATDTLIIPGSTARARMGKWKATRDSIDKYLGKSSKKSLDKFVARGFLLPINELSAIVAEQNPQDSIWAMLAIKQDSLNGAPKGKPYVSIIYMVRKKANATATTGGDTFYDFTKPCPDFCPSGD